MYERNKRLIADARLAAKCLKDTNTFETGQAILNECADYVEELLLELKRLETQCEGLAQAALNSGQELILTKSKLDIAVAALQFYAPAQYAGINFRGYDDGGECAARALIKIGLKSK